MAIWNKILGEEKKPAKRATARGAALTHAEKAKENAADGEATVGVSKLAESASTPSGKGAGVLMMPHTTEKATDLAERGAYMFRVAGSANKQRVARAVAERYGVAVAAVRMIVQPAKERRRGRQIGWKSGFKKAIVQLKEGQRIETL